MDVSEMDDGRVFVQVKSRRGTGTRDEDEVVVRAVYEDAEEAERESHRLNDLLEARLTRARNLGDPGGQDSDSDGAVGGSTGEKNDTGGGAVDDATADATDGPTNAGTDDGGDAGTNEGAESWDAEEYDGAFSKIYLGEASELTGWIPLPRWVVAEEILPPVRRNTVTDEDTPSVKLNFSSEVPVDGWTDVSQDVALDEIEPLVRQHRLDR